MYIDFKADIIYCDIWEVPRLVEGGYVPDIIACRFLIKKDNRNDISWGEIYSNVLIYKILRRYDWLRK